MNAKYIKQEISDLNGTGRTQAYYKMKLKPELTGTGPAGCVETIGIVDGCQLILCDRR